MRPQANILQVRHVLFLRQGEGEIRMLFNQNTAPHKTIGFPVTPFVLIFDGGQNLISFFTVFIPREHEIINMSSNDPLKNPRLLECPTAWIGPGSF